MITTHHQQCGNCRFLSDMAPAGPLPGGLTTEHRRCTAPRIDAGAAYWRRPENWCDMWQARMQEDVEADLSGVQADVVAIDEVESPQDLTLHELREANARRQDEWPGSAKASLEFRALEVAGECGKLAEAMKKFLRGVRGIAGKTASKKDVAMEMADALISLDILAMQMGIDLAEVVRCKFNQTSVRAGLKTRLK